LSRLKRVLVTALALALMLTVIAAPAFAFHHGGLPSTTCAADQAGSPSNDNGQAKENLTDTAGQTLPLPPVGTPGNGQGEGGEHCAAPSS
jgi:hypothetical protein